MVIRFTKYILLLAFLFFIPQLSISQTLKEFSTDKSTFLEELEEYMSFSKRKVLIDIYKEFAKNVNAGTFTPEEFTSIQAVSNLMIEQRMTASPFFENYLKTLIIVKKAENGEERFKNWQEVLTEILTRIENRKTKPYKEFLAFSYDFFYQNAIRYSKSGISWIAIADEYELTYGVSGPQIVYEELDLLGIRKADTISLQQTSGTYYPVELLFRGSKGKVNWGRFELENEIYAELGDYELEVKKSIYEVTEAKLYYPDLFPNGPIEGKFEDKLVATTKSNLGSYPRFESKERVLKIDDVGGGLSYQGGFRLQGTNVYGFGTKDDPARMRLIENGKSIFSCAAEQFVIRKGERIAGERVQTSLYFEQDSIYHPSVNLKFDIATRELGLTRGKRGSDRNPFYNSFHQMNLDAESLNWLLNENRIVVGKKTISFNKSAKQKASFESFDYFSEAEYNRFQNISSTNPLAILKVVAEREGDRILDAEFLAKKINPRYTIENAQSLYYDLVAKGFINYDSDKQLVEIRDKVFHYADAHQGKVDYDYLRMESETDSLNAFLDLSTKDFVTNAVDNLEFSKLQKVAAKPYGGQVILKQNRDMDFGGKIFAGYSTLTGKDFHFEYDKYHILMDSVRYFDLFVPTGEEDDKGNKLALSIASRIEHAQGVVLIDAPANKSGVEKIPVFPSFQSKGNSYVYYDLPETQDTVYTRDSFYFELDPFSFNSLDNYLADALSFKGQMISADIFPPFKETLVLQEDDQSLGFQTQTPAAGYPTYTGKGTYKGEISLSNKGFLAKGNLTYLGASIDSEDIVFKPKQMVGSAERFDLNEDRTSAIQVPEVRGFDVRLDWKPYRDSMYVYSEEAPFNLYKANDHTLEGTLVLTPDGVKGIGLFDWSKGQLRSKLFSFGPFSVQADTTAVKIKALEGENFAFDTQNVKSDIDFDDQKGTFVANADDVVTTMPFNQYQTTMNEFTWDMQAQTVVFKTDIDKPGRFTSIHPDQDSLFFDGKEAFYDLNTSELKIEGVEEIQTCDAFVYPEDGKVDIQKGGVMTTLENASIVCNTENKYHTINKATVNVKGKKDYTARGYYQYDIGDRKQEILFEDIVGARVGKGKRADKKTVTRATGEVESKDDFFIDVKTQYRGTISLNAESKNLSFDGFASMDSPILPSKEWFSINSEADKNNLIISFDEPKNYRGDPIRNGLYLSKESARIYPRVMMPLYYRKDRPIIDTRGHMKYNKEEDTFIFGDSTRVVANQIHGNILTFSNRDGSVKSEGTYNIGSGLTNGFVIKAVGRAETAYSTQKDTTSIPTFPPVTAEFLAGVMMNIPEKLKKIVMTDLKANSFDVDYINYTSSDKYYEKALAQWVKPEEYTDALAKLKSGFFELPKKTLKQTFIFGKLPMKWDFDYQSFISTDEKIHLAYFDGESINKLLECYVEFKMPSNDDDRVYVYIKSPSDYFYFFGYKAGILSLTSNNNSFMEELTGMKPKELIVKSKEGEFEIQAVETGTANTFVSRVKAAAKN